MRPLRVCSGSHGKSVFQICRGFVEIAKASALKSPRRGERSSWLPACLRLGFGERVRGSHHIFWKEGVEEILNLQPKGGKAKPYQVKQVRHVILKYKLGGSANA